MKWIVITMPDFIENEANNINQLFEAGLDLLHLRKPDSCIADCERLLQEINPKWYPGIVVHDHFSLCGKYHLHGIHLNRRNHQVPDGFQGSLSRSCHSFEEVTEAQKEAVFSYVFLSPIFDSISKKGYKHCFSNKDLEDAGNNGIINEKVIALGGVIPQFIPQLRVWNFGGAAFLGDIWNRRQDADWAEYLTNVRKCLSQATRKNTLNGSNVW